MKTIEEVLKEIGEDKNQNLSTTSFKFKSDVWYKLPKEPKVQFRIEGFDKDGNRVILLLMHPTKGTQKISLSEENFNNLLYQPELFDRFDI